MTLKSCDTMVALGHTTQNGQTIFAKNSDRPADECQPLIQRERRSYAPDSVASCQFIDLPQVSTTYRHVGSRPHWCWGYEHGFNEHQVVIGNEALPSKLAPFSEPKLIGMEILRLGLERARTAAEAITVMTDLITHYGQGAFENDAGIRTYDNGYIVTDPHQAYVLETAGHEWAVKCVDGTIGISNVYSVETDWAQLSPEAAAYAIERGWWPANSSTGCFLSASSQPPQPSDFNFADAYAAGSRSAGSGAMRRGRSCAVLKQYAGSITGQTMIALLSDHSDGQFSTEPSEPSEPSEPFQTTIKPGAGICVHSSEDEKDGNTAASQKDHLSAEGSRLPVSWCSL